MIIGVGIDIVDVGRFTARIEANPRLGQRLLTPEELGLRPESMAARFAAKEALAKALGAPVGLRWSDATVVRAGDGRPHLRIIGTVAARAEDLGVDRLHLSLSHDAGMATAFVIAEGQAPGSMVSPYPGPPGSPPPPKGD